MWTGYFSLRRHYPVQVPRVYSQPHANSVKAPLKFNSTASLTKNRKNQEGGRKNIFQPEAHCLHFIADQGRDRAGAGIKKSVPGGKAPRNRSILL